MVIPIVEDKGSTKPVPTEIQWVLEKYRDVMPENTPKALLLHRGIDHGIELWSGVIVALLRKLQCNCTALTLAFE